MDSLIESLPGANDEFYIEHREGTNYFRIRKDPRQVEKEHLMELILNTDKKLARTKNKANTAEIKDIKNRVIEYLKEFGEEYVETD